MVEHVLQVFDEQEKEKRKEKEIVYTSSYVVTLPPFQEQISLEILIVSVGFIGHVALGSVVEVEVVIVAARHTLSGRRMGSWRTNRNGDAIGTSFPARAPRVARIGVLLRLSLGDEEGIAFLVLVTASSGFRWTGFRCRWRSGGSLGVNEVHFGVVIHFDEKTATAMVRREGFGW